MVDFELAVKNSHFEHTDRFYIERSIRKERQKQLKTLRELRKSATRHDVLAVG